MTTAFTEFTALEPGQTLRVAVDAGAWIRVVEGRVQLLSTPAWLSETVFNASATLGAEDMHVVERDGWIEVVAQTTAQVHVVRAAPVRSAHLTRLGRWLQLLAGRLAVLRIR
jgi:hypothetical protein